jgi:hypothetical protein
MIRMPGEVEGAAAADAFPVGVDEDFQSGQAVVAMPRHSRLRDRTSGPSVPRAGRRRRCRRRRCGRPRPRCGQMITHGHPDHGRIGGLERRQPCLGLAMGPEPLIVGEAERPVVGLGAARGRRRGGRRPRLYVGLVFGPPIAESIILHVFKSAAIVPQGTRSRAEGDQGSAANEAQPHQDRSGRQRAGGDPRSCVGVVGPKRAGSPRLRPLPGSPGWR